MNREARVTAGCILLLLLGFVLGIGHAPALRANYNNITNADQFTMISGQVIAPGGVFTQGQAGSGTRPFKVLEKTVNQAIQIQGTGTSPNYKVELLVSLDHINFAKPEVGGDLGTFTDQNLHIIPLSGPLCFEHEVRVTEMGSVNSITITEGEISQ